MRFPREIVLLGLVAATVTFDAASQETPAQGNRLSWTHFTITESLPGTSYGTGGIPLADFDGDEDLDVVVSRRETQTAYWFERRDDLTWVRHIVGKSAGLAKALGATALDMNHDGSIDVVSNKVWFENPGTLQANPNNPWTVHAFAGGGHDIIAADIDGNGQLDVITYDGTVVSWFDPSAGLNRTDIGQGEHNHGGIAPRGAGDLDGDSDVDIVIPGYWFENPGKGRGDWQRHSWPHLPVERASYGTSMRVWIADINGDRRNDIVYSDCDTGLSHVYCIENVDNGLSWRRHQLPDPPTAAGDVPGTGSFHSLGVADFDRDGDLDIFAGEQEDPDTFMKAQGKLPMKPPGLKERGVVWLLSGRENPVFEPVVIQVDNPGWHDAALGDVDGDGDIDIVTKIWNKDGASYHVDYWRNDSVRAGSGGR